MGCVERPSSQLSTQAGESFLAPRRLIAKRRANTAERRASQRRALDACGVADGASGNSPNALRVSLAPHGLHARRPPGCDIRFRYSDKSGAPAIRGNTRINNGFGFFPDCESQRFAVS